ncbi:hypothetical protein Btru_075791 [Bulinus truncatus]|nr:hypothetical protein Btru_075791 [Bulinus truncatus]
MAVIMLNCTYRDADDFHSEENKLKMASGIPLTDEDRIPWLLAIHVYIKSLLETSTPGIVTCSALKRHYRNIVVHGSEALTSKSSSTHAKTNDAVLFVYLKGSKELISARLNGRKGHFMPPGLLESQFDILEEPDDSESHITVDIDCSVETLVDNILKLLIK